MTDGVYAFAMTLLVVNIELPEGFEPKSNQEFLTRLSGLSDTFIAYLITFFVLVSFWFGRARTDDEPEMASATYAWAVLIHLLSITYYRSRCSRLADTTSPLPSGSTAPT